MRFPRQYPPPLGVRWLLRHFTEFPLVSLAQPRCERVGYGHNPGTDLLILGFTRRMTRELWCGKRGGTVPGRYFSLEGKNWWPLVLRPGNISRVGFPISMELTNTQPVLERRKIESSGHFLRTRECKPGVGLPKGGRYRSGGRPCAGENVAAQRWGRVPFWKRIGGHTEQNPGSMFSENATRISRISRINKSGISSSKTNRGRSEVFSPTPPFLRAGRFLCHFPNSPLVFP